MLISMAAGKCFWCKQVWNKQPHPTIQKNVFFSRTKETLTSDSSTPGAASCRDSLAVLRATVSKRKTCLFTELMWKCVYHGSRTNMSNKIYSDFLAFVTDFLTNTLFLRLRGSMRICTSLAASWRDRAVG